MKESMINTLFVASAVLLASCSDDENVQPDTPFVNPEVAEVYVGTQSPGDVWTWSLDKEQGHMTATWDVGTFDDTSDDISIEGTFETLPSGFLKVTITKAEPATSEIPTDGTAWFYALEVPDMALVIKPEGSIKGDIIAMVAQGDCNDIEGSYNYIITAPGNGADFDPITEEAFGFATFTPSGSNYEVSGYKWSLDCINGGACSDTGTLEGIPMASCTEGGGLVITEGGATTAQGQFTAAGAMMMDFGYGNGGVFALKATEAATKDALLDNTYNGIVYMPENNDEKTRPVKVSFFKNEFDNMVGTGHLYSDLENNLVDTEEGAVIIVENVVNGRVYGTMGFHNGVTQMAAALHVSGDDQILILSSTSADEGNPPFILVLAKQ